MLFPGSTFVIVRNVGHVTALADYPGCAAGIVRRFLRTLSPGEVSCAERTPEIHVVPEFPRRTPGGAGGGAAPGVRRPLDPTRTPRGVGRGVGGGRRARALVADAALRTPAP